MMKKVLAIAIVCMFCSEVFAGKFQLSVATGYGFGAGRDFIGYTNEINSNDAYTSWKDVYASMGSGIKCDVEGTVLFNDNVGILFGTGFSMLGGYKTEYSDPFSTTKRKIYGNYIPIVAGLKFTAGNRNVLPYLHIAPGVFFPVGVHGEYVYNDTTESEITRKYSAGFCLSSGIGVVVKFSGVVGLKLECSPFYGFARLKEETEKMEDGSEYKRIYLKNELHLPESTTGKMYSHGGQTYSFSSIAAKVGVVLSF